MIELKKIKEYLAEERFKIQLYDLVAQEVREILFLISEENFTAQGSWSKEEFKRRIDKYEEILRNLCQVQALLAFWGEAPQRLILTLPPKRLSDPLRGGTGSTDLLALRWYPILLILYSAGIAAVAGQKYENLVRILQTPVIVPNQPSGRMAFLGAIHRVLDDFSCHDPFRFLPEFGRKHTPQSEHLLKTLQPLFDEAFNLGLEYESSFDRFEVLCSLEYIYQDFSESGGRLEPIGRFAWKYTQSRGNGYTPLHLVISESEEQGIHWPPIQAGLFGGSPERFKDITTKYIKNIGNLFRN